MCEVGEIRVFPLGEELLTFPLQELPTWSCTLWFCLPLTVWAYKVTAVESVQPCLNCGDASNQLWCSSVAHKATKIDSLAQIC